MTGRLIASLIWMTVVLVPPFRVAADLLARFLWPSKLLGAPLGATRIPLACFIVLGWILVTWLSGLALSRMEARESLSGALTRPHGGDSLTVFGLAVTAVWFVGTAIVGHLTCPLAAAAVLVILGIIRPSAVEPVPEPGPIPIPRPPVPLPKPPLDVEDREDDEDDEFFYRSYRWLFNEEPCRHSGREFALKVSLTIPRNIYNEYKSRSHKVDSDAAYVSFAEAEINDEVVSDTATRLRGIADEYGLDPLAEIHLAMSFTLAVTYASDDDEYGREYPKYPVESLVEKRGDCEDHANLCGAVLHRLGYRVGLVLMTTGPHEGHAALVVEAPVPIEGVSFSVRQFDTEVYYCEVTPSVRATTKTTTDVQWWLGMEPPSDASNFRIYPING